MKFGLSIFNNNTMLCNIVKKRENSKVRTACKAKKRMHTCNFEFLYLLSVIHPSLLPNVQYPMQGVFCLSVDPRLSHMLQGPSKDFSELLSIFWTFFLAILYNVVGQVHECQLPAVFHWKATVGWLVGQGLVRYLLASSFFYLVIHISTYSTQFL